MNHLLKLLDLSPEEIIGLLNLADQLKYEQKHGISHQHLAGKTLGMILGRPSTRTRVSFEVGMVQLGGYPLLLKSSDLQLGHGEPVRDTARSLSGYLDAVMIRTASQQEVEDFAKYGRIPVINALTDCARPCEALADLMTIREHKGNYNGLKLAFVGDGAGSIAHSTVIGSLKVGMEVAVATPKARQPHATVLDFARSGGNRFTLTADPVEAVQNADVVVTHQWDAALKAAKATREDLMPYQVGEKLLAHAKPDAMVQHCLPAHPGEEISEAVFEQHSETIYAAAENRLHIQKAVLVRLLGRGE